MAKKTSIKVRLVPEGKPNSPFFYYVKKPNSGDKAKVKLKIKKLVICKRILSDIGENNLGKLDQRLEREKEDIIQ